MAFLDREGLQKVWAHMNSQIYKKAEKNKEELTSYLIDELAKRNQLAPEFANSVEECIDEKKLYVLPDGYIYAYLRREETVEGSVACTNMLTHADIVINKGKRYSKSSNAFKDLAACDSVVIPIPTSGSITVRFRDCKYYDDGMGTAYTDVNLGKSTTSFTDATAVSGATKWLLDENGDYYFTFTNSTSSTYMNVNLDTVDTATDIITINEEIIEGVPNFTNLLTASTTEIKTHTRYSQSSAEFKTGVTNVDSVIIPIPSGDITLRFRGISYGKYSTSDYYPYIYGGKSNTNFTATTFVSGVDKWTPGADGDIVITFTNSSGCTHAVMMLDHKAMSTGIVTLNEEITYTEGGTTVVEGWESTGHAFVPADYEDRIITIEGDTSSLRESVNDLKTDVEALKARPVSSTISTMIYAPSPQLPADGSETADFDAANIDANEIYEYIDALVEKHPRYLTKETLGKDESGTFDWNRYTASRRTYDAWVKPMYPAMYGWTNGSTTVYSVSVSPRVDDTMYSTAYIGTAYSTVTAVDNASQSRTINGLVFVRDANKDITPTLVYTYTDYDTRRGYSLSTWHNSVYSASRSKIGTISEIANGTLTDTDGNSYTRYPMGDRNSSFKKLPTLVIGSNEHGGNISGDPAEAAIISSRLIKDLCERRHADNAMLNMLKSEYMIVFCPVINPWGYGKESGYVNANGVNIDRNFDTPGWGHDVDTRHGDYGGSENETQFFMNTVFASGAKIALANHVLGTHEDTNNCGYMLGRDNPKYNAHLAGIAETMAVDYDLTFITMGQAPGDQYGKTRSYFDHIGIEGGALEMCALAEYLADGGTRHTAKALEADYTLLLQFLHMLIECQEG